MKSCSALRLACALAVASMPALSPAQTVVRAQGPCTPVTGQSYCFVFDANDPVPVVRAFTYTVPGPGRAVVSFHGAMFCGGGFNSAGEVIDLVSQIVSNAGTVPSLTGPGALRHATRLASSNATGGYGLSTTFNLASTRVFALPSAGTRTVYFKLDRLRMDASTDCTVYNAAFTVVFVPT